MQISERKCFCSVCEKIIPKGYNIFYFKHTGWRTSKTFYVCPICINEANQKITDEELNKLKSLRIINELENDNTK